MKMRLFIVFALAACLSLSACSERNVDVSDNSSVSNTDAPVTETASEPSEEVDSNNLNTPEDENSLGIGASNSSSTEDDSIETPTSSSSSEDGYSKRNFGTFSLWLPDNYVIEENVIYEDGTELARKIAEITSIDAISNTASPFEIYDQTYSNAEAVSEFSFGGYPAKSYHLQTEVSHGGITGFQNEIIYCIETDKNIIVITFYPAMGIGIYDQRKEFEKILNSISVNESADTNSSYKQLSISLPRIGDEEQTKVVTLVCPTNWTNCEGRSTIDINGKKGIEIYCYSFESAYQIHLQILSIPHRMNADTSSPVRFDIIHYALVQVLLYRHSEFPVWYVLFDYIFWNYEHTYFSIQKQLVPMKQTFSVMDSPNFLF